MLREVCCNCNQACILLLFLLLRQGIPVKHLAGLGLISGMTKKELIDAIAASSKLTKADAG